jgi:hypothetical protein
MLTKAEKAFLDRVALQMVDNPNLSLEDAMRAVRARDEELWLMTMADDEQGKAIRHSLAVATYEAIRS